MDRNLKQIYDVAGGAFLGLSLGVLGNGVEPGSLFWLLVIISSAVIGLFLIFGSVFRWPFLGLKSKQSLLAEEGRILAADIMTWLDSRNDAQPSFTEADWDALNGPAMTYHNDTVSRWQARYGTRALSLHDKLISAGAKPAREVPRFRFEFPVNPLGIKAIGHALVEMGSSIDKP